MESTQKKWLKRFKVQVMDLDYNEKRAYWYDDYINAEMRFDKEAAKLNPGNFGKVWIIKYSGRILLQAAFLPGGGGRLQTIRF
jgi:hypothetical protein